MTKVPLAAFLARALTASALAGLTAGAIAQTTSINFAVAADIGNTTASAAVANLTRSQNAQFVVMPGDLCYDTNQSQTQIASIMLRRKLPGRLFPALGNHEFTDLCGGGKAPRVI